MLTEAQIQRYARHVLLPKVGGRGQERLLEATVRVDAEGPEAQVALSYLAAAGVCCEGSSVLLAQTSFLAGAPLAAFNEDAARPPGAPLVLLTDRPVVGASAQLVLHAAGWVFVPPSGCAPCASTLVDALRAAPALVGASVTVGAFAALRTLQHLAQLLEPKLDAAVFTEAGWRSLDAPPCGHG